MPSNDRSLSTISIIIPTKNRATYLARCLDSVCEAAKHCCRKIEVIVVDGGSTDATPDVLQRYRRHLARVISEADAGVSDAVNKGVSLATGEALVLFADDDELLPQGLNAMVQYMEAHEEVDVLMGHGECYTQDFDGLKRISPKQPLGDLTFADFLRIGEIGWPAPEMSLMRRELFNRLGGYDLSYRFMGCLELWLRWSRFGGLFRAVPLVMARKIYGPESANRVYFNRLNREYLHILWRYGGVLSLLRAQTGNPPRFRRILASPLLLLFSYFGVNPWLIVKTALTRRPCLPVKPHDRSRL